MQTSPEEAWQEVAGFSQTIRTTLFCFGGGQEQYWNKKTCPVALGTKSQNLVPDITMTSPPLAKGHIYFPPSFLSSLHYDQNTIQLPNFTRTLFMQRPNNIFL